MSDRYSERGGRRWEDEMRRDPYESRSRERDWGWSGRGERGFFERAGDELRSWFGDEEAQRRRMADERDDPRYREDWRWRERDWERGRSEWSPRGDWGREPSDREWGRQWGYVESRRSPSERSSGGRGDYGASSGYGTWGQPREWNREESDWARYAGLRSMREREATHGPYYGRGPRNYQRADERIREDVCERLAQHSYLDPSDVDVAVRGGEVTLQGTVNDRWAKRTVEEIAEGVWGVKEVHNQLRVTHTAFAQDQPSAEGQSRSGDSRSGDSRSGGTQPQRGNWAA